MLVSLLALHFIYKGKASLNPELTDSDQLASQVLGLQLNSHTVELSRGFQGPRLWSSHMRGKHFPSELSTLFSVVPKLITV